MARIAVVEDDVDLGQVMADYLRLDGHSVDTHESVESARGKLVDLDLVITDVGLPLTSGLTLCKELAPSLPVIVVSGDPANAALARNAGARRFLLKPLDVDQLVGIIDEVLADPN